MTLPPMLQKLISSFWRKQPEEEPTPLTQYLVQEIELNGPMTIEEFMQIVLHDPTHGYYRQGIPVGKTGDFSTGPEVSQMFGEMYGLWCYQVWERMGKPDPFILLELGPGRGTLLKSMLEGMSSAKDFLSAMRLRLLESNESLRAMQLERLAVYQPVRIEKLTDLPSLPVIVIGNEFFDTFPLRQFMKTRHGWRERLVGVKKGKLILIYGDVIEKPVGLGDDSIFKNSDHYEISPLSLDYVATISAHIAKHGGAALLIDYGYDEPIGEDTLFAFCKHVRTGILHRPGETDVTADVDLGALSRVARDHGLRALGSKGQGAFFKALGIDVRALQLKLHSPGHEASIDDELHRLTHPSVMGEWFKAIVFAHPSLSDLPGFDEGG